MAGIFGALAASKANFAAGGMSSLDPQMSDNARIALGLPSESLPQADFGIQSASKCVGDYTRIPLGWRPSALMGQCGFKIQLNKFYSATSPCYPVQDISCLGAVEKKAWANICKTEFPCKPFSWPNLPKAYSAPPGLSTPKSIWGESSLLDTILRDMPALLGVSLVSCFLGRAMQSKDPPEATNSEASESERSSDKPIN